jgi:ketosteroid isomerase-like protein
MSNVPRGGALEGRTPSPREARLASIAAVTAANEAFYEAFEAHDLDGMSRVWLHDSSVRCVHPNRDLLQGWRAVRASWKEIFGNLQWIRLSPTAVSVSVGANDDVAVVVCTENVTEQRGDDLSVSVKVATNIFRKSAGAWRMVHHHASPAPVNVTQPFSGIVQ